MAITNVTPDSFYAGSRANSDLALKSNIQKHLSEGADIIDIGAYSTRPGADDVDESLEAENIVKAIKVVKAENADAVISVDTFRAGVARKAVDAGAHIINDISGGNLDPDMFRTVAELGVPYVLMHSRGTPKTMNGLAQYADVVNDVIKELSVKVDELQRLGVADIIIDPGFGFAKNVEHNFELLRRLDEFSIFDLPLLVGISRKSMIWRTLNSSPEEALNGTTVLNTWAAYQNADILRVHDVREAKETIALVSKIKQSDE
ncbi:MAG: dihydropteroate synthase [Flavobacteriales bacterium]|nr:dihydropteroate synthase [Flavobacteriales bacterium]